MSNNVNQTPTRGYSCTEIIYFVIVKVTEYDIKEWGEKLCTFHFLHPQHLCFSGCKKGFSGLTN